MFPQITAPPRRLICPGGLRPAACAARPPSYVVRRTAGCVGPKLTATSVGLSKNLAHRASWWPHPPALRLAGGKQQCEVQARVAHRRQQRAVVRMVGGQARDGRLGSCLRRRGVERPRLLLAEFTFASSSPPAATSASSSLCSSSTRSEWHAQPRRRPSAAVSRPPRWPAMRKPRCAAARSALAVRRRRRAGRAGWRRRWRRRRRRAESSARGVSMGGAIGSSPLQRGWQARRPSLARRRRSRRTRT